MKPPLQRIQERFVELKRLSMTGCAMMGRGAAFLMEDDGVDYLPLTAMRFKKKLKRDIDQIRQYDPRTEMVVIVFGPGHNHFWRVPFDKDLKQHFCPDCELPSAQCVCWACPF